MRYFKRKIAKKILKTASNSILALAVLFYSFAPSGVFIARAEEITPQEETAPPAEETPAEQSPDAQITTDAPAQTGSDDVALPSSDATQAEDPIAANTDTGADSANTSEATTDTNTTVENNNTATVSNNSYLSSDTGHNTSKYNTGTGTITTQKASGQGELINIMNENFVQAEPGSTPPSDSSNTNTGAGSTNDSQVNINNTLTIKNNNNADVANVLKTEVFSGANDSSYNTGHGIITTGPAELGLNFVTFANANFTNTQNFYADWQNIYGNYSDNIDLRSAFLSNNSSLSGVFLQAANSSTGADSTNTSVVDVNNQTTVENQNKGKIRNEIDAKVVSGQNKADYNVGSGNITTGDARSALNILNFLNANVSSSNFAMKNLNVFGNWTGSILMPVMPDPNLTTAPVAQASANTDTGAGSTNDSTTDTNTSTDISNQNDLVITNNVLMKANTGTNQASNNTGAGSSTMGTSNAQTNTFNVANLNITGNSWWMVVVNKFGAWSGKTLGLPSGTDSQNTPETSIFFPQNSGILAKNQSTGPDSNNSAGVNINDTTDISNQNTADIINEVKLQNITGENEAVYNSGNGAISTGNIESAVNLVNFANVNMNVGNWTVVVVNVFGDWSGDLVFNQEGVYDLTLPHIGINSITAVSPTELSVLADGITGVGFNTVPYWFEETSGNAGGLSSVGWQEVATFDNPGLLPNTLYKYRVKARDAFGNESNFSPSLAKYTLALPPTNFEVTFSGDHASLEVNALPNDTQGLSGYYFFRTNDESGHNSGWLNQNTWQDTGLTCNTPYSYSVKFRNGDGTETNPVAISGSSSACAVAAPSGGGGGGGGTLSVPSGPLSGLGGSSCAVANKKRGDINCDGKVDLYDFSLLMSNWGKKLTDKRSDINSDSKVDFTDFSIVMYDWTKKIMAVN